MIGYPPKEHPEARVAGTCFLPNLPRRCERPRPFFLDLRIAVLLETTDEL